jgi:formylglycine-generating enzyme required for sulfatase activity
MKFFSLSLGLTLLAATAGLAGAQSTPTLGLSRSGTNLLLSWPTNASNYVLQFTPGLSAPGWQILSNVSPVTTNGQLTVTLSHSATAAFYRLYNTNASSGAISMVAIPPGTFVMGNSADSTQAYMNEMPVHTVTVSAFHMDANLVTYAAWKQVYNWATSHGYSFDNGGSGITNNHPVQTIDWYDAVKWCNARSEMEGRTPAYYTSGAHTTVYRTGSLDLDSTSVNWTNGYRLPTEAEWEWAARGGLALQRFPWGTTISWSLANYYGDPSSMDPNGLTYDSATAVGYDPAYDGGATPYTSPVGSFPPNGYGLYDMAGNVFEFCWDSAQRRRQLRWLPLCPALISRTLGDGISV